jgi:glycosyltransferase involved in cell wall biosynthesis
VAREQQGLPQDRPNDLFGAVNALTDPNKGWQLLQSALGIVAASRPDPLVAVFGAAAPDAMPALGLEAVFLGRLRDDASLVAAYSAADVMVVPSRQESFCQTATEAMACGTPVVAFGATGLLDLIEHQQSGYLAEPYQVEDLARGIAWVLADRDRHAGLAQRARRKVVGEFALEKVTQRYLDLYETALEAHR